MENKPLIDRSLFVPLSIGALAVVGICLVLLALRLGSARSGVERIVTETPVKYMFLGTEPAIVRPTDLPTSTLAPTMTELVLPDSGGVPATPSETLTPTGTTQPGAFTATSTPTNATDEPSSVTYDDMESVLTFTGNWVGQSGLTTTYQETLHISTTIGDAVQFRFYGEKFYVRYQAGPSLGAVAIKVDTTVDGVVNSVDFVLNQSASATGSGEWDSSILVTDWHTITITHISGGSVNIDSVVLFTLATPTPTSTPTITPTP